MIIKIVALGFIGSDHAYMTNWWNIMDLVLVAISWVTFYFSG